MGLAELDFLDVLQSAPLGAVILDDRDDEVVFWNGAMAGVLGGLRGDGCGAAAAHGFFHDENDFGMARALFAATGVLRDHEVRIWRADGQEGWATVTMEPIRLERNAATLVWYADVTEAKRREPQLERSQHALLEVLDAAPMGAALTDGPGRICYWNSALLRIFPGHDGDPAPAISHGIALARAAMAADGPGTTFRLPRTGGVERLVTAWESEVEFQGSPAGLVWLHDVTELHLAELSAKAATIAKSGFLAMMSHEIRTPMNGVLAITDLLAETPLSAEQASMIKIVQQSAESLILVINDILDFSKLESSQLKVEKIGFQLDEVVDGVVQLLSPKATEKGLSLHLKVSETDDMARVGDPLRLRQVLLNLVGNSIKFTAEGSVTMAVAAKAEEVTIQVADTGIGIPAGKIGMLFRPYEQIDIATARFHGGTGLGLSISKALMGLMGGDIEVESTEGCGSCFTVRVKLPRDRRRSPRTARGVAAADAGVWQKMDRAVAEANGVVILCAEDNPTNRIVLGLVLDRLGLVYEMAEDGAQALAALDRSRHGLILSDGHMPVMDGWELARAVRTIEAAAGLNRLPILMATADAVSEVAGRAKPGTIDRFLTKPLRRDLLDDAILRALPALKKLRVAASGTVVQARKVDSALDLQGLIKLVGGSRADLEAILEDFRSGATAQHAKLSAALAAGDRRAVVQTAHAIKGAAGYAGAKAVGAQAQELEAAAKRGVALEALAVRFETLTATMSGLPEAIAASLAAQFGEVEGER